jgi:hypothetical protein
MRDLRVAGAPISWGVCEVPGWGYQLPPERVLAEMRDLGLTAAEFGPEGFLPADPAGRAATLRRFGLGAVGGFLPVVLHEAGAGPLIEQALDDFAAAGAEVLVLAAATGGDGYDTRPELDDTAWKTLLASLDLAAARAADRGLTATLHPHVGTTPPSWPARRPAGSPTRTSRTWTRAGPSASATARSATPKRSRPGCTARWARATWTWPGWSGRCAGPATTAGSCWSRTPC